MKKSTSKILALILVVCLSLSLLTACDWFTTNKDRDMAQVIASVQISDEVAKENIYKRELVAGYQNYGWQYQYYYGYSEGEAYQVVLDNLIDNRIIIQQSRLELAKLYNGNLDKPDDNLTDFEKYFKAEATANGTAIDAKNGDIENLKKYLTEYEIAAAYYSIRSSVNSLIDSYVDEDDEASSEKESATYTDRTAPTVDREYGETEAELKEQEPYEDDYLIAGVMLEEDDIDALKAEYKSVYALNMAIWEAYKIDISSSYARKKAYGSLLQELKDAGLIASDETYEYNETATNPAGADNVLNYSYFESNLKSQLESALVSKYEKSLVSGVQDKLTDEAIWEQYKVDYENQKALYEHDYSSYETALSNASDTSFVLYNPIPGYGYVANLLIGFTDEQQTMLSDYKAKDNVTNKQIIEFRAKLVDQLFAKDQRSSWVFNNHGTYEGGVFTFEDDYTVSDIEQLKSYIGKVVVADEDGYTEKDDNDVERTKWNVLDVVPTSFVYDQFVSQYLTLAGMVDMRFERDQIGMIENFDEDALNKINDLIYVFSTDPGSLSNEYGYLYSPLTSSKQYVREFADAAKAVVEAGVGSYTAVITDFGIHIIVCTKKIESDPYDVTTDGSEFKAALADEDSLAYKYKQVKLDAVTDTEVSKIANQFITKYREEKVTKFESTYEDLIPKVEDSSSK